MKRFLFRSLLLLSGFSVGAVSEVSQAQLAMPILAKQETKAELASFGPTEYLRLTKDGNRPKSLDVAITSFTRSDSELQVDLIGAIHIGEKSYYSQLNKLFDQYEVLLYELVAAEGTVIPRGGKREGGEHPLAMIQGMAKSALGLESQLEQIDYTKKHMIRADLTPEQMSAKMEARGDTPITLDLSAFADAMRQQNLKSSKQSAFQEPLPEISLFDLFGNSTKQFTYFSNPAVKVSARKLTHFRFSKARLSLVDIIMKHAKDTCFCNPPVTRVTIWTETLIPVSGTGRKIFRHRFSNH